MWLTYVNIHPQIFRSHLDKSQNHPQVFPVAYRAERGRVNPALARPFKSYRKIRRRDVQSFGRRRT
jgi:hypothetical protein